jgi:tetratricopeptide (TPR) repeat protein
MPPEMFEQFLREDARAGGEAGEEAAALVALLEEMGGGQLGGSGLPPELAGLLGGARGGGGGGGRFGEARSERGAGASPAGPGEGGGGGGGGAARRARARHAGQSAFRRGKKGGSPGTRPAASDRAGATLDPETRAGGSEDSSSRPDVGAPLGSTPGSRTEKNRRKKARKKEKERGKDTEKEGSVYKVTRDGEDADGPTSRAASVEIAWAPDAFYARRREDARSTRSVNSSVDTFSTDADLTRPLLRPDREVSRRWVAAAKAGDVAALRGVLETVAGARGEFAGPSQSFRGRDVLDARRDMLEHRSPGIGHTALHWSASRGIDALDATAWLLTVSLDDAETNDEKTETNATRREQSAPRGLDPNARNLEGATPLHAAAGIGSMEALALLAASGADPRVRDEAGETAADVAARRGHASFASACRDGETVFSRDGLGTETETETDGARFETARAGTVSSGASERAGGPPPASEPEASVESDSSDDEASRAAKLAATSAEARRKGNAAFAAGEFAKAVKQFTMAIRMDKTNHVLFSNRSAAHAGLGKYEDALADAERCVRMSPKWGKGYGRKGAALTGLGQGGEAVKAYLAGLAVEPESEALRAGLAEAKAAIRQAQDRYKEMWGKDAPHSGSAGEDVSDASREGTGDRETKTVPKSPTRATSPTSPTSPTLGATKTPSLETLAETRAVNALPRAETKRWLEAARGGELATLENMLSVNRAFLHAWGKGTNFGFTANTAMHWAASKGHAHVVRWLLRAGASPDARNNNDSAPTHSAAGAGRADVLFLLLAEGGADATLRDGCDETARDVAIAAGAKNKNKNKNKVGLEADGARLAAAFDLGARVGKLRADAGEDTNPKTMDLKTCREVLQLAGVETRAFAEKREFIDATREYLDTLPPRIRPPGGKWVALPSLTAEAEQPAAPPPPPAEDAGHAAPAPDPEAVAGGAGGAESDSSDDEASRAAKLAATSAEARRKGNAAFAAGEFAKAVKQFTMAIRMDKTNHVLFSNRSAAHAGLGKYEDALADAERCVRMSPKWGKGYGRKGAALTGLGQGGEAVKAYLAGLAVEPESEALRAGLAEAKAAIRQAQDRYKEMWGKDAPHSGSAAEEP